MSKKNKKYKIAAPQLTSTSKLLPYQTLQANIPHDTLNPIFSVRYYDHSDHQFSAKCIQDCKIFHDLFSRLQTISQLTWGEIKNKPDQFHAHEVDWRDTSRHGTSKPDIFNKFPAFQFKAFKEFRVVGCLIQGIFHIVWLDPEHKLYPRK